MHCNSYSSHNVLVSLTQGPISFKITFAKDPCREYDFDYPKNLVTVGSSVALSLMNEITMC